MKYLWNPRENCLLHTVKQRFLHNIGISRAFEVKSSYVFWDTPGYALNKHAPLEQSSQISVVKYWWINQELHDILDTPLITFRDSA